jgi:hypothetical protein
MSIVANDCPAQVIDRIRAELGFDTPAAPGSRRCSTRFFPAARTTRPAAGDGLVWANRID